MQTIEREAFFKHRTSITCTYVMSATESIDPNALRLRVQSAILLLLFILFFSFLKKKQDEHKFELNKDIFFYN